MNHKILFNLVFFSYNLLKWAVKKCPRSFNLRKIWIPYSQFTLVKIKKKHPQTFSQGGKKFAAQIFLILNYSKSVCRNHTLASRGYCNAKHYQSTYVGCSKNLIASNTIDYVKSVRAN